MWSSTLGEHVVPRPGLPGDTDVDVAIVGAGFTGLWTAYYLKRLEPTLRVAVLEREVAGFGASGRNGGWCSALFAAPLARLAKRHGLGAATALRVAMQDSVDEIGNVAAAEGIDCHFAKGGTVRVARSPAQLVRQLAEVEEARSLGVAEADLALLDARAASELFAASHVLGATYTPHCAALHPGRLVRGLARAVEHLGVEVYERTEAFTLIAKEVRTDHGKLRADVIVRATEAYTAELPGLRRALAPFYSLMLATAPLAASFFDAVGLARRETFADNRHLVIYGQRTADDRLAFGGRGAPYHFGSSIRDRFDTDDRVHEMLAATLAELLPHPDLADVLGDPSGVTHRWGGPLGIPRDWYPGVTYDHATGLAAAGGYVGDGVGTSNLAGRTLADLILRRDTDLTRLCWVGHRSRRWEPEPARYAGVNAGIAVMTRADAAEARTGRPSRAASLFHRLTGS